MLPLRTIGKFKRKKKKNQKQHWKILAWTHLLAMMHYIGVTCTLSLLLLWMMCEWCDLFLVRLGHIDWISSAPKIWPFNHHHQKHVNLWIRCKKGETVWICRPATEENKSFLWHVFDLVLGWILLWGSVIDWPEWNCWWKETQIVKGSKQETKKLFTLFPLGSIIEQSE